MKIIVCNGTIKMRTQIDVLFDFFAAIAAFHFFQLVNLSTIKFLLWFIANGVFLIWYLALILRAKLLWSFIYPPDLAVWFDVLLIFPFPEKLVVRSDMRIAGIIPMLTKCADSKSLFQVCFSPHSYATSQYTIYTFLNTVIPFALW